MTEDSEEYSNGTQSPRSMKNTSRPQHEINDKQILGNPKRH